VSIERALDDYLAEAASWDRDRDDALRRAARRAWLVASAATIAALLAIAAILALTPLKRVEAFVVRVDNSTGIVDVVPGYRGATEQAEPVTRYLLQTYVSARERFVYAMAESDYTLVGAFQSPQLNQAWIANWSRQNAASPLNIYKDGTTVRAQVTAISFLKRASGTNDLAQVRFLRAARIGGSGAELLTHWIATVQYCYIAPSTDERYRALNPLGFRIIDYRREAEIVAEATGDAASNRGERP
jgi:type IV secretion system protein VirB8